MIWLREIYPCIRDKNINRAETFLHQSHESLHRIFARDISSDTKTPQFVRDTPRLRNVQITDRDTRADVEKFSRKRQPDAAGAAGDHHGFA